MKNILITISFLLTAIGLAAQPAGWSVSGADYEYTMTISAIVEYEEIDQGSANDFLGAFVGSECRGIAEATYIENNDNYVFFIAIFANEYTGETVDFKFFNNENETIIEDFHSLSFAAGQNIGTASIPYIVSETEWVAPISHISVNAVSLFSYDNSAHLTETFNISNLGGGYLSYQTTMMFGDWCTIQTTPQELSANESAPITVQASTDNLAPGNYYDTLTVHSERLIHIPVSLTISSVGINTSSQVSWSIFPNPAQTQIRVEASSIINKITIIDACGKSLISVEPRTSSHSINTRSLPQGIYFTKISTNQGETIKKLLIE